MRLLADDPKPLSSWRGAPSGWRRESVARLAASERALWEALGPSGEVWVGEESDTGPAGFWSHLLVVGEAPESQFDVLRRLLSRGLALPGPVAAVALTGRRFHGHHGRDWVASAGNLHLSVALEPAGLPARNAVALTMLPAVAAVEGIVRASAGTLEPGIKWVNDILIGGRKVAGVLAATQVSGQRLTGAVLGLGVNVATTPPVSRSPFVPEVGSLAEAGAKLALFDVLGAILDALAGRFAELLAEGPTRLHDAYRQASVVIGREVCVWEDRAGETPDAARTPPRFRGIVRDIGPDLSLHLEGQDEPVTEGRLLLVQRGGGR